ncbi:MAG: DUF2961 domain-containing protein [Candidatus Marinimicrobia bacterium]|nr:DUF2961 domain-containing protein [FCB group bacterium]MBL7023981.1 DUF2961 domain-containing protein [Candidatus Neomarinimicrobiota bacterium]
MRLSIPVLLTFILLSCGAQPDHLSNESTLFEFQHNASPRWASFENPTAEKGAGGTWNKGAKGHAFDQVLAGETKVLLDVQGSGIVQRMWITNTERDEEMLRSLILEMFWDESETPAVSVPMGDFFGDVLGHSIPFENALFSDPEGRSFNCIIPMPFKTSARIQLTNTSERHLRLLFYDINFVLTEHNEDMLYFHASWHREENSELGVDFEILPKVKGKGRFLGSHIGIITNPMYKNTWWGEGEVKVYLDGDTDLPTLNGTGAEDYPGSAWGLNAYINQFQGCFLAESPRFTIYRYHIPDPIFFEEECRVTIQRMGGASRSEVIKIRDEGAELLPVTQGYANDDGTLGLMLLQDMDPVPDVADTTLPNGWMNFYRSDDYSATAFFYLDTPDSELPILDKDT